MLVFSIQFTNVSTKYNTIHSTVVVLSHSICVWLWDYQQIYQTKEVGGLSLINLTDRI